VSLTHSVSAGLDYALVRPGTRLLHDQGRAEYVSVTDREALDAARTLALPRASSRRWSRPMPSPKP